MKCYALVRPNGDIQKISGSLDDVSNYFNQNDKEMLPLWNSLWKAKTPKERSIIWKIGGWEVVEGSFIKSK